jgi:predicted DNA binding CopG/RHH family protein
MKKQTPKLKKFPRLRSDAEAEALLAQDLSGYDFSQFKPVRFKFVKSPAAGKQKSARRK